MKNKIVINILLWTLLFLIMTVFYSNYISLRLSVYFSLITIFFQIAITYLNLFLWIPLFLKKKRILFYLISIILTLLVLSAIRFQLQPLLGEDGRPRIGSKFRIVIFEFNMLLTYSLSTAYYFIAEWFRNLRLRTEMKFQQVESELKYLKNQINPHFLFNTLNNIYTLSYLKDDKAAPSVLKLSEMMRYMLYESNTSVIELEREVQFIRNYLELMQLKKDENMLISFTTSGIKGRHKIAPLILIAFFENCFKHGDIETNPDGWLNADLKVNDRNEMTLVLCNSSKKKLTSAETGKHVGLENVKRRLSLLYERKHNLEIFDEDKEYKILLTLTLEE